MVMIRNRRLGGSERTAYTIGMTTRVGLYGGSFDPIHFGHLIVVRSLAERLGLERVVFLPSARPPHKEDRTLAPAAERAEMVRLAIEGEPLFAFSDFDLTRAGPSYTIDTVTHFREQYGPAVELHWIVGADSLAELATWRRVGELVDVCRIVTAARTGCEPIDSLGADLRRALGDDRVAKLRAGVVDTPVIDISSTDVRHRIRSGQSIRYLVPNAVADYIACRGVYQGID